MNKEVLKNGLIAGVMGMLISFCINFAFLPVPQTVLENSIGNGISGFMSGFMGASITLIVYKKSKAKANSL